MSSCTVVSAGVSSTATLPVTLRMRTKTVRTAAGATTWSASGTSSGSGDVIGIVEEETRENNEGYASERRWRNERRTRVCKWSQHLGSERGVRRQSRTECSRGLGSSFSYSKSRESSDKWAAIFARFANRREGAVCKCAGASRSVPQLPARKVHVVPPRTPHRVCVGDLGEIRGVAQPGDAFCASWIEQLPLGSRQEEAKREKGGTFFSIQNNSLVPTCLMFCFDDTMDVVVLAAMQAANDMEAGRSRPTRCPDFQGAAVLTRTRARDLFFASP